MSPPAKAGKARTAKSEKSSDTKPKMEKVNAWEDDSDIEYIDGPDTKSKSKEADADMKVIPGRARC